MIELSLLLLNNNQIRDLLEFGFFLTVGITAGAAGLL
jgi:hypothetical protein